MRKIIPRGKLKLMTIDWNSAEIEAEVAPTSPRSATGKVIRPDYRASTARYSSESEKARV